jgi:hypothetical protein
MRGNINLSVIDFQRVTCNLSKEFVTMDALWKSSIDSMQCSAHQS